MIMTRRKKTTRIATGVLLLSIMIPLIITLSFCCTHAVEGRTFVSTNRLVLDLKFENGTLTDRGTTIEYHKPYYAPYNVTGGLPVILLDENESAIYMFTRSDPRLIIIDGETVLTFDNSSCYTRVPFLFDLAYVDIMEANGTTRLIRVDVRSDIRDFCVMSGEWACLQVDYHCGDSYCDFASERGTMETCQTCSLDCGPCASRRICNKDDTCDEANGETVVNCPHDCSSHYDPNATTIVNETTTTTIADYCGNGMCEQWEDYFTCPSDCEEYAPDHVCDNDGSCEPPESEENCPADCIKQDLFTVQSLQGLLNGLMIALVGMIALGLIIYYIVKRHEKKMEDEGWEE